MKYRVTMGGRTLKLTVGGSGSDEGRAFVVTADGSPHDLVWSSRHGVLAVRTADGVERHLALRHHTRTAFAGEPEVQLLLEAFVGGRAGVRNVSAKVEPDLPGGARAGNHLNGETPVRSPITGKVIRILVQAGDAVEAGQALVIIEAMKMENRIFAPAAGRIKTVSTREGDAVHTGRELLRLGPAGP